MLGSGRLHALRAGTPAALGLTVAGQTATVCGLSTGAMRGVIVSTSACFRSLSPRARVQVRVSVAA